MARAADGRSQTAHRALVRAAVLTKGTAEVIGYRLVMGVLAPASPATGAEAGRLLAEKALVVSAGALVAGRAGGHFGLYAASLAVDELLHAGRAAAVIAAVATPIEAAVVQANYTLGFSMRMLAATVALADLTLEVGTSAMLPAQRAVLGNARRLRRMAQALQ